MREHDFGTTTQGKVLNVAFPVFNGGARRLILVERVNQCCGESARQRRLIVPSGGSETIEIELDTKPWYGKVESVVTFDTNDTQNSRIELTVFATVEAPQGTVENHQVLHVARQNTSRLAMQDVLVAFTKIG